VLIAANQDSMFARLGAVMSHPGLAGDARFAGHRARANQVAEIDALVGAWTLTHSSAEVLTRLHEAEVPAGLGYEPKDTLKDSYFTP
jgi:formyl-CoA transferase